MKYSFTSTKEQREDRVTNALQRNVPAIEEDLVSFLFSRKKSKVDKTKTNKKIRLNSSNTFISNMDKHTSCIVPGRSVYFINL